MSFDVNNIPIFQSMIIFDCADGQLARLTNRG
jgi:hypothetical protein